MSDTISKQELKDFIDGKSTSDVYRHRNTRSDLSQDKGRVDSLLKTYAQVNKTLDHMVDKFNELNEQGVERYHQLIEEKDLLESVAQLTNTRLSQSDEELDKKIKIVNESKKYQETLSDILAAKRKQAELDNTETDDLLATIAAKEEALKIDRDILASKVEAGKATKEEYDDLIQYEKELADIQNSRAKQEELTHKARNKARRLSYESSDKYRQDSEDELFKKVSKEFGIDGDKYLGENSNPFTELGNIFKDSNKANGDKFKEGFDLLASKEDLVANAVHEAGKMARSAINNVIDSAANTLAGNYGQITAALEGSGKTFKDIEKAMQSSSGVSTLIKQEQLLSQINAIANQGISTDIEQIALLSTIKDKTVSGFNVSDSNLRRLIKLNQNKGSLTAKQFGLADALKESFNEFFGDSSFIGTQFQSLIGTVMDAVSANANSGGTDSTGFYSVLESWLGAMSESGVDSGTINSIAQGINYLGSGNVQALSGNKQLQNLMLLSMDRAGLDYANILQQGLSDNDANTLLKTIVDYLAEITDKTNKNNVLQNAYSNLFNMSVTDMTAIQNLSQSGYSGLHMNGGQALAQAVDEVNALSDRTLISEKIDNFFDNAQYTFGSSIATNTAAYIANKSSNFLLNILDSLQTNSTAKGKLTSGITGLDKILNGVRLATTLTYAASTIPGVLGLGKSLISGAGAVLNGNNSIADFLLDNMSSGGIYDGGTSTSVVASLAGTKASENVLKQFSQANAAAKSGITDTSTWENDFSAQDTDPVEEILKEFQKTLMKSKEGENYAFAVSLQGMSDSVLRSFASIFADEESLESVMNMDSDKRNKFLDQFIEYATTDTTKKASTTTK